MMMKPFGSALLTLSLALTLPLSSPAVGARSQDDTTGSVKVHGHWTIDVRDPDGALVEHREFENAYVGGPLLARILARQSRAGRWHVELFGPVSPCSFDGAGQTECFIIEPPSQGGSPTRLFPTLTVTAPTQGPDAGRVVLSGHATATSPTPGLQISKVRTWHGSCEVASPGACSGGSPFSEKSISPIAVVLGQIIQVTVVLSFQ